MESTLVALAVLACPVGMGLMMWFMGRGIRSGRAADPQGEAGTPPSLEHLREEQARLAAQIQAREQGEVAPAEGAR